MIFMVLSSIKMPRKYKRMSNRQECNAEDMKKAIKTVFDGDLGYLNAAETHNVPKSTLQNRVNKFKQNNDLSSSTQKGLGRLKPRIDFNRKTLLIAIGYLDSTSFPISAILANEYEARGYNIILLDNQRFATVHYYIASRLMRPVGKHVSEVLVALTRSGLDPSKLELLGFSLGGQTVGYIARNFQLMTGQNISKITALEPSGPCFRSLPPEDRLDASNADFVEVIHTNIDGYGMATRMGHVDFYINGGEYQPSEITMYPCATTCSHFRVLSLWVSALKHPGRFIGIKCDSIQQARDSDCYDRVPLETNVMGLKVDRSRTGIFFVSTSKSYPYYLGKRGLQPEYASWRRLSDVNMGNETEIFTSSSV